jgi:uncharacterized protein YndB with AHSA1/START domain
VPAGIDALTAAPDGEARGLDRRRAPGELAAADRTGAFMPKAQTLSVHIARPITDVYEFMSNPANLSRWTVASNGRHEPKAGLLVWSFDGQDGRVQIHFTRPNPFHVLDYRVYQDGQIIQRGYVRLIADSEGTILTHTAVQEAGVADTQFDSEVEWVMSDLLVLKTLLEN